MGDVAWRPLLIQPEARACISASIAEHRGDPYDHDKVRMMYAALDCCPCCEKKDNQRMHAKFCSQVVAQVLQDADVLPKPPHGPPANEYLPRDFGLVWGGTSESFLARSKLGPMHIVR